ncbi:hypothetical protein NBRC116594_02370 [Shimia sp. NS0008-38b]
MEARIRCERFVVQDMPWASGKTLRTIFRDAWVYLEYPVLAGRPVEAGAWPYQSRARLAEYKINIRHT